MLPQGTRLGPYKILSQVGAGGMGEVYRAVDVRLDREVAIKVLAERLVHDPDAILRFEREAKAVAALSHPNILAIHDFDRDRDIFFTASELLEGETLRTRIARSPLPWRKTAEIGMAIAEGLAAAHSKGIVHRDLKPENIFVTSEGQVKILDFGLAAIKPQPQTMPQSHAPTQSAEKEETMLGTVGYMSPEQVRGVSVDGRSDIFSLGCILYEMATGTRAFLRETVFETVAAILKEDPPELAESGKKLPLEMQRLISHCLEKNPTERLQSAHDLAFDLKAILTSADSSRSTPVVTMGSFRLLFWIAAGLLLILAGVSAYLVIGRGNTVRSIAVLPFENTSNDPNIEYLSEGISESIINRLSQLQEIRVMARSTVFRYKGRDVDPQKIGHDLKVDAVLTGFLIQQDGNLTIKAELIKVADGSQLWGQDYNARITEVLPVQEEISAKILERLHLKLSGEEQKRFSKPYTQDTEAYNLYLKGRYYWNKRTPEGLKKGIEFFQQAIDRDPSYALAYTGLADSYALLSNYEVIPQQEGFQRAKAAATKALEIDEQLAEAHTSLAHLFVQSWEWSNAEKEFRRAIELKPGYSTAHHWYANYLLIMGRLNEAIVEIRKAQELDPLSLIINETVGLHLYVARQFQSAIEQIQKTLELDPNFYLAHATLGEVYVQEAKYLQAIQEFQTAIKLSGGVTDYSAELAHAYAVSGQQNAANTILNELLEQQKTTYVSPVYVAMIYVGLGKNEEAFIWLQKAYEQHSESVVFIKSEPRFDSLRKDPRFQSLLRRLGIAS